MNPREWIEARLRGSRRTGTDRCEDGERAFRYEECEGSGCDSVRLTELPAGTRATVTCLEDAGAPASRTLAAIGILPGEGLTLLQRYPAYVLRVGFSEFALDGEMASRIRVRPTG